MNSEAVPNLCPRCCAVVPADAPQGLCPRCVLARAVNPTETGARSGVRLTPPPLEAVKAAFPQFEILELIGVGGMGVVYKARQPKLDRIVALKLLPQSPSADPAFAERFHREARFLARLTHPFIVSVFDFGESGGFCFLLMEFVDGVNLRQAMQAGRFSPAQALAIVPDICAALQYAHNQGVLHRDIKPENILLDAQGRVKIADFGIAKLVGDPGDPRTDLALTQSGARLGTPHYMAPEQIEQPSDVDHRADIYSLGVVFYELLTGELPLGRFAAPSAKTPLDARVDEIVMRALAKERELRQQSAGEMKTQVETVTANPRSGPPEAAQPSVPSGLLKVGTGTLTTPERLATFAGQFFLYRTRGPLILDRRQLTHSCAGVTTVIPLVAIRDLSIGHYPRSVNPAGLDFISVTYEEGGQAKRVFLSPMDSIIGLPPRFNQQAADWFHTIYNAVGEATGRTPGTTPAERLGTPAGSKAIYGLFLLPMAVGAGFVSLVLYSGPPHGPFMQFLLSPTALVGGTALAILWAILWAFKAAGRAPEAATPAAPATRDAQPGVRAAQAAQAAAMGWPADYEYRSPRTLFGRPLVHVAYGTDPLTGQARVARGIIAMGQKAIGVVAIGGYARGLIAIGGVAVGGLAFGGLALGLFAFAGLALGLVSVGGLSIGLLLALGGGAFGLNAGGGLAVGKFAAGGLGLGKAVWDARRHDEAARWIFELLQGPRFPAMLTVFSLAAGAIPTLIAGWLQWHRHRSQPRPLAAETGVKGTSRRRLWLGLVLLPVAIFTALMPFLIYLLQQRVQLYSFDSGAGPAKRPEAAWIAADLSTAKWPTNGQAVVQITRVSSEGAALLLEATSEAGHPPHHLSVSFIGAAAEAEPEIPPGLQADGILEPRRLGPDGLSLGGRDDLHLLAGTNDVAGPGSFRFAFVFPDQQSAELARQQVSREFGNRPLGFPESGVRQLISLSRFVGTDPQGQPLYRVLGASLFCQIRSPAKPLPGRLSYVNIQELQLAQNRLTVAQHQAALGMVAPQGREVLDAEVAVAEAEAKFKDDPHIADTVRLKRAAILFAIARKMEAVGSATHADVERAQLEQVKVRTAFAETLDRATTNSAELKWLPAWNLYLEEEAKNQAGRTSPAQFSLAIRELSLAEAELLHEPLWAAQARESYRQSILAWKRLEHSAGRVSQAEVDNAEQLLKQAEDERREVEKANPPAPTVYPAGTLKVEPAPSGEARAKADSPRPTTHLEPARPLTDFSGEVRFSGEASGRIELTAKHPTRLTDAIMELGQNLGFADLKKVKVQHVDGSSEVVNVARVLKENAQGQDLILRDGDRVEIPPKVFTPLP